MPVLEPRTWIQIPVLPLRCCLLRHVWVFVTPRTAAHQASVSFTISRSLLKLLSTELIPFNHLIHCCPLLLPSVFPSIRIFSSKLALCIRWPEDWSFSFSVSPSNEYSGKDWLVWSPCSPGDSREFSPAPQLKSISSSVLILPYGPPHTSVHDYWRNHSFD